MEVTLKTGKPNEELKTAKEMWREGRLLEIEGWGNYGRLFVICVNRAADNNEYSKEFLRVKWTNLKVEPLFIFRKKNFENYQVVDYWDEYEITLEKKNNHVYEDDE